MCRGRRGKGGSVHSLVVHDLLRLQRREDLLKSRRILIPLLLSLSTTWRGGTGVLKSDLKLARKDGREMSEEKDDPDDPLPRHRRHDDSAACRDSSWLWKDEVDRHRLCDDHDCDGETRHLRRQVTQKPRPETFHRPREKL